MDMNTSIQLTFASHESGRPGARYCDMYTSCMKFNASDHDVSVHNVWKCLTTRSNERFALRRALRHLRCFGCAASNAAACTYARTAASCAFNPPSRMYAAVPMRRACEIIG